MEIFFRYATPFTYWLLIIAWTIILVFYFRKIRTTSSTDKLFKLLLLVLALDAFRTLFESLYFGAWYTSLSGLIPLQVFTFLAKPQIVFFPKMINLIAAIIIITILLKKWMSSEIKQKNAINELVKRQTSELAETNLTLIAAKEKAEESEERYRSLVTSLPVGIFRSTLEGKVLSANPAMIKLYGYDSFEELTNVPAEAFYSDENPRKKMLNDLKKEGHLLDYETLEKKKDGSLIWVSTNYKLVYNDFDDTNYINGVVYNITERKQAEQELLKAKEKAEESEERFDLAMKAASDGLFDWNLKTNEIYYSPAWKKMLGYEDHELPNDFSVWEKTTDPEDVKKSWELQQKLISKEVDRFVLEFKMKHKNGHWVDILSRAEAFFNDSGKAIRIVGTHTDITERKQAELLLQEKSEEIVVQNEELSEANQDLIEAKQKAEENEVKYRLLYDSNQMPISIFDVDSLKFLSVNNAMAQKYGYTKEEFLTMTILDIRPESEITKVKQAVSVMDEGLVNAGIFLHKRKNGEIIQVEIIRCEIIFEGKRAKLVFAHDVTERLKMEQELLLTTNKLQIAKEKAEENEEYFRNIFENSAVGKSITGLDGSIKTNKAFSQMLGYPFEEFQTKHIDGITHPDDIQKTKDAFDTLLNGEKTQIKFEKRYIHKNGSIVFADVVSSLQKDRNGNPLFFITSVNDITERKLNEEKLIKSEERYALGIEASEQGIWDRNVETNEVFYSEQWKKQIGYADDELKNEFNTWIEHLHPDEKEYCQNAVQAYLTHPVEHFILDFRFRHKDGSYRWIHNKAASIKNKEGKVVRLFGTHTDFTESKLSEAIFKEIIEKNPMSIQILNMEGYPIQVNPAHTKLFGVEPPPDYSVFKDNQLLSLGFDKLFDRIKKGEVVFFPDSYYNVHDIDPSFPDSPVWVKALGFTLNDNNGIPNKIVLMHENITERKNADALLNDIIENNPMSIQVVDKEGHTVRGNPAFIQLFGSAPPPGFSIFDDLKSKSVELANLVARVKNGEIVHLPDIYFNTHDSFAEAPDIPLWIRALIFPLKDSAGKPERFVFMHENITERKLYEAEIHKFNEELEQRVTDRTAQLEAANKELEAFSYSVSHDLRTPLRALNGFATILTEDYSIVLDDEGKRLLSVISENATKMGFLIDDLLSFSRLGRIEMVPTPINMKAMAAAVYNELVPKTDKDKIRFTLHNLPAALGDSSMIKQVWVNLIGNAIKFTSKKTGRHIEIGVIAGENENIYFVKDNGAGFEMAHAQKLFGVFQRLHTIKEFDGIGAGLAIVRRIILRHNGRVWAEGKVNEGATFYFTLPHNPKHM